MKPRHALLALLLLTSAACSNDLQTCNTDEDCFRGEVCNADNKCSKRGVATDMSGPDLTAPLDLADSAPDQAPPDMAAPDQDVAEMDEHDQATSELCVGVTCSMHGRCEVSADAATCACDPGYIQRGLTCADATQIVLGAGSRHTCAIKQGTLSCWGDNASGQLGTLGPATSPKTVINLTQEVEALALGFRHTCAVQAGALFCWGDNSLGQLGIGDASADPEPIHAQPVPIKELDAAVTAVSAGERHTCAIKAGALFCWGANADNQLGIGSTDPALTPTAVSEMDQDVSAVAAGSRHTCAIKAGVLSCWGDNAAGQTGHSKGDPSIPSPRPLPSLSEVSEVATGKSHTCALAQGRVYCWGDNTHGQLGVANDTQSPHIAVTPTEMYSEVTAIAAGRFHTCAIKQQVVYCWGNNDFKQVANNDTPIYPSPIPTYSGLTEDAAVITTGDYHTCIGLRDLSARCWGNNEYKQLGANLDALP